jgi:hypothetical protein
MLTRPMRPLVLPVCLLVAVLSSLRADADRLEDLARALMQDPSYKVRVQAALVLGKLGDKRAVPALLQALHDDNETVRGVAATSLGRIGDRQAANALLRTSSGDPSEFVRAQARKALELVAQGGAEPAVAPARAGARFYLAIGFAQSGKNAEFSRVVREALVRELQKLPSVTLSVGGEPSAAALAQKHLQGYVVDGTIQRLSSSQAGGQAQVDCDLKAFVATYPGKAIKMMTSEGASLQTGSGPSEESSAKRDCLVAAVEAVREDVGKFLKTLE